MRRLLLSLLTLAALLLTVACSEETTAEPSQNTTVRAVQIADGLEHPWAMTFLPGQSGLMLVTERPGRMRLVSPDGTLSRPLSGVPTVFHSGQGGLLDVIADPGFRQNRQIYFSYAEGDEKAAGTAVARAKLNIQENILENVSVIFRQRPKVKGSNHFGSRLVFDRNGLLHIGLGDRYDYSDMAQELDNHLGKVVRITPDGRVPESNPFVGQKNALGEIWSFGHRNIQGAARHPKTGVLWIHEHGPRGGDEINIPQAGENYGWPLVSFGSHYSGWPIPDRLEERDDLVYPLYHWTPSIAPSGMMFYTGTRYPEWQGDIFVGTLAGQHLAHLKVNGNNEIIDEKQLLGDLGKRFRDVTQGPDGYIYTLTDEPNGEVLRVIKE